MFSANEKVNENNINEKETTMFTEKDIFKFDTAIEVDEYLHSLMTEEEYNFAAYHGGRDVHCNADHYNAEDMAEDIYKHFKKNDILGLFVAMSIDCDKFCETMIGEYLNWNDFLLTTYRFVCANWYTTKGANKKCSARFEELLKEGM